MVWSINFQPYPNSPALNEFLLIAGRATYFATSFERLCKSFHRHQTLEAKIASHDSPESIWEFIEAFKGPQLDGAIRKLRSDFGLEQSELDLLIRAKEARNFIAHELTDIGPLATADIGKLIGGPNHHRLQSELPHLIRGFLVISKHVFNIDNNEFESKLVQEFFPQWVEQWVHGAQAT